MADKRLADAVRDKNLMAALVASEGWKFYDSILQEREAHLLADFLRDDEDYSDAKLREFRIGLKLIRVLRMTPATIIDEATMVIAEYAEEEDQDYGEEEGSGHPDG